MSDLEELSPKSKVWIYQADRALQKEEKERIREMGEAFASDWSAHGKSLKAAFRIFYDRFLVFFVDGSEQEATGCSIDRSVHFIKGLESEFDLELLDRKRIAYRDEAAAIDTIPFDRVENALEEGRLKPDQTVFNNLVRTKEEFQEHWEVPLHKSWVAGMLKNEELLAGG